MPKFTILHLSDTHFREEKPGPGSRIRGAMVKAIEKHVREKGRPDLIVFSGDLANSGKSEEYEIAEAWLKSIQDICNSRLFIVPGNHDIQRPRNNSANYNKFLALAQESREKFESFRQELGKAKYLASFFKWHDGFRRRTKNSVVSNWSQSVFFCEHFDKLNGVPVVLIGINTAITSFQDGEDGSLVCDSNVIDEVLAQYDGNKEPVVAVVVTHHPAGLASGIENTPASIAKWNDTELQEQLLKGTGPHLYLHGHLHDQKGATLSLSSGQHLAILAAGAGYTNTKNYPLRFSFVEVDIDNRHITPTVYGYNSGSGIWFEQPEESIRFLAALPKPLTSEPRFEPIDPLTQVRAIYQTMRSLVEQLDDATRQQFRSMVTDDLGAVPGGKQLDKVFTEFGLVGKKAPQALSKALRLMTTGRGSEGIKIVIDLAKSDKSLEMLLLKMLVASPEKEHWELASNYLQKYGSAFDYHALAYGYWSTGDTGKAIELTMAAVDLAKQEQEQEQEQEQDKLTLIRSMSNLAYYYAERGLKKDAKIAKQLAEESLAMLDPTNEEHESIYRAMLDTTGFVLVTFGGKTEVLRGSNLIEQAKSPSVDEELRLRHLEQAEERKRKLG